MAKLSILLLLLITSSLALTSISFASVQDPELVVDEVHRLLLLLI